MTFDLNNLDMVIVPKGALRILLHRDPLIIKVYLYGLLNSSASQQEISGALGIDEGKILSAFESLQQDGLIEIDIKEKRIIYKNISAQKEELDHNIYTDQVFNSTLEQFFGDRVLNRSDYETFYRLIDTYDMEKEVVLTLAEYCIKLYGNRVSSGQIMKTAALWKDEGIDTREKANRRLASYSKYYAEIKELLTMLSIKRAPTEQEMSLYEKWVETWGFSFSGIKKAMDATTGARNPSLKYLDGILKNLYQNGKLSAKDIEDYFTLNEKLDDNIKEVLRELSYSSLAVSSVQREKYLSFLEQGFTQKEILLACRQGKGRNRIDLEYVGTVLGGWKMLGLTREKDILDYLEQENRKTDTVKEIYRIVGKTGTVSKTDVNLYNRFRDELDYYDDVILYAAECAKGYATPLRSMNTILTRWKHAGVRNLADAKRYSQKNTRTGKNISDIMEHDYSSEQRKMSDPRQRFKEREDNNE